MDVRDFAPALLALSDLFDESNRLLNGPDRTVQLRIRHDIKHGSFDVAIQVVETWVNTVLHLFNGDHSGINALLMVLGFVGSTESIGLLRLIKQLRGRPVLKVELSEGKAKVVLQGDEIFISRQVATLFNDLGIRRALSAVLAPLRRDGIDSLDIRTTDGKTVESVARKELPAFEPPVPAESAPEKINISEFTQAYTIVSLTFKDGNKWRLHDGQSTISATIEDEEFLTRVNNHETSFLKDDMIRCDVRQEQSITPDGLTTATVITRVLEHKHAYRQTVMPMVLAPAEPAAIPPVPKTKAAAKKAAAMPKATKTPKRSGRRKVTGRG